ncbi:N-acetylmuramoyl-L-alanine amidase family protein [Anaerotignum sp. MB30-C6]|uniref:N-acetylmuramoyl-L-alanine amidase family protein n=1 Tax=Anaerotignum sp. MB30-C6 TaxID=3070814 RepID=UPI0027DC8377|nr:N-acetylmuramoyl-L-alanine amidase [Anaerotignum sp. MB30-C6]WMI80170.1 N-acetylmuramoyl-L-alanine amidase [Anaerotignum sp. MB30-C6]
MPRVYISPSLQNYNLFINGGTEEEYVNLVADAMDPYLLASEIEFSRNEPGMTLSEVINDVNRGDYDVYFSIHTSTAPPSMAGHIQGAEVYYFVNNPYGRELAEIIAKNLKRIYPNSEKVKNTPTATLKELTRTRLPAVLVELGYNDNEEDAQWIKDNIRSIAKELSRSLTEYFAIPLGEPEED